MLNVLDKFSPYTFMFGDARGVQEGILVYPSRSAEPRTASYLWPGFDCQPVAAMPAHFGRSLAHVFHFYRCERVRNL